MFVNGKEIFKDNKNINFQTQFCLGSVSIGFSYIESRQVSLNGIVYDFSVDYNFVDKFDILNIQKYLLTKNNKVMFSLIKQVFIALLSFSGSLACIAKVSEQTICLSLNDEPCMVNPTLINLNSVELKYYLFIVSLDKCSGSCNSCNNLSTKICVPIKQMT